MKRFISIGESLRLFIIYFFFKADVQYYNKAGLQRKRKNKLRFYGQKNVKNSLVYKKITKPMTFDSYLLMNLLTVNDTTKIIIALIIVVSNKTVDSNIKLLTLNIL